MTIPFWMVNAFTNEQFKGNPAGVFVVEEFPDTDIMQSIAAELNWSQTAFVKPLKMPVNQLMEDTAYYHIRWFSPRDEAPICGHATLGSAHVLWQAGFATKQTLYFESKAGPLIVSRTEQNRITMDFPLKPIAPCEYPGILRQALVTYDGKAVDVDAILRDDTIYIVVLKNPADMAALKPTLSLIETLDCRAVSVTSCGLGDFDFQSRYFAPKVGIPEDPVCGSSHARLAPYWAEQLGKRTMMAYQASKRSGILWVTVDDDRVHLAGNAVTIIQGTMDCGDAIRALIPEKVHSPLPTKKYSLVKEQM